MSTLHLLHSHWLKIAGPTPKKKWKTYLNRYGMGPHHRPPQITVHIHSTETKIETQLHFPQMKKWPMTFPSAGCPKNTTGNMHQPTLWSMRRAHPTSVPSVSAALSRAMSTELSSKRADWEVRGTKPGDMNRWDRNRNLRRRCVTNNVNHHHHHHHHPHHPHPSAPPPPPHHYHQHQAAKIQNGGKKADVNPLNEPLSVHRMWNSTINQHAPRSTQWQNRNIPWQSWESWLVNTD